MTRLLIFVTILLSIVSYVSAQIVDTLNTPSGPVTQGANVAVTWTLVAGVDATGKNGDFSATDSTTQNVIPIASAVPLAPKSYTWNVQVPPGTYVLGLNDGSGSKQSGQLVVKALAGGAPAPPAGGAPAPPAGGAPAPPAGGAPAPPAGGAPAPPAGGAPSASKAPATAPSASAPSPSGTPGAAPSPAGSTPSTPSSPAGTTTSPSPATTATGSASSIFSGYEVVFSLLGVAIAMVQF
uniref:Formin-like protein 20 n=1 Tax=Anthurium amnicola TaxID=1678845 RepID=A0A1D1Z347_9ARAE